MKKKTPISLTELNQKIEWFKIALDDFSNESLPAFEHHMKDIKDDMQFVLLESVDRQNEREKRRDKINQEIRKYNKQGPQKAIDDYIAQNPKAFREALEERGISIDDRWNYHLSKQKKGNHTGYNIVPVQFTPKTLVEGDQYEHVRARLQTMENEIMMQLTNLFELAKEKAKNIYASYAHPGELFDKLNISIQKVGYAFFAKEQKKDKLVKKGTPHDIKDSPAWDPPTFKKIGALMKHLKDNNIPFRANNILQDNNQRFQFYFYDRDITILISDEVIGNCFRDSTYAIKGMVPWLRNVNREELKSYQGKKIVFNEHRSRRMESVFKDDPQHRPIISEEKEEGREDPKTMITDRSTFIGIIKEHFTPETLTIPAYRKFAQEYNSQQGNALLLCDTVYGCASLLGLWGKKGIYDIKNAIFESQKPKLEIPKNSFFHNDFVKMQLQKIWWIEGFDPDKTLWSVGYTSWVLDLIRKASNEEYVDAIKNLSVKEKKARLESYVHISDIPLFSTKITSMLGGRVRCVDAEYQKMLWERYQLYMQQFTMHSTYKDLEKRILSYETAWEDGAMHPNSVKKTERQTKRKNKETRKDANQWSEQLTPIGQWDQEKSFQEPASGELGRHKVMKFCQEHPDRIADGFVPGETYEAVINNINERYAFVSLTRTLSGRIIKQIDREYKVGDIVKVVFDHMDTDRNGKTIVKIF